MFRFAIVHDKSLVVESIATWDGTSVWRNPPDRLTFFLEENSPISIGWTIDPITNTFFQPAPVVTDDGVRRLSKIYFMRLFDTAETIRYNSLKRQVAALTIPDYEDPSKAAIVQAEVMFQRVDSTNVLELEHAETQQGLQLLAYLGLFGPDPDVIAARIAAITAGLGPTGVPVDPTQGQPEPPPEDPLE